MHGHAVMMMLAVFIVGVRKLWEYVKESRTVLGVEELTQGQPRANTASPTESYSLYPTLALDPKLRP